MNRIYIGLIAVVLTLVAVQESHALCPPGSSCQMCWIIRHYSWDHYHRWARGQWTPPADDNGRWAAPGATRFVSQSTSAASRSDFIATPPDVIPAIIKALRLKSTDTLYELGCGDARVSVAAIQATGCRAVAFEREPQIAEVAQRAFEESGTKRYRLMRADFMRYDLDLADAVYVYLFPEALEKLAPKLKTRRIASYLHRVPGMRNREIDVGDGRILYVVEPEPTKW